jgi:hypothetical protein
VKASVLASGRDADAVTESEVRRQVASMTSAVAGALACLPALGEDRSGPLGPGRLSGGHVGQYIRAIQAQLGDRSSRGWHRHVARPTNPVLQRARRNSNPEPSDP